MRTSQMLRHNRGAYAITPGEYHHRMARVRACQRVLATRPDVPVILDFRRWAGRPIAFRDAECTDPVQAEGDPLGGVRHPITWEIIATQPISADRPYWTEDGAVFGGGQSLHLQGFEFDTEEGAAVFRSSRQSGSGHYTLFEQRGDSLFLLDSRSDSLVRVTLRDDEGTSSTREPTVSWSDTHTSVATYSIAEGSLSIRHNGTDDQTSIGLSGDIIGSEIVIGRSPAFGRGLHGAISTAAFYGSYLDMTQRTQIVEALS